ncbi:MAG: hypothetical protein WDZ28_04835 [Simkaniaceae bacterium]
MIADHFRFLKEGRLFTPYIAENLDVFEEGYDAAVITLDAGLSYDLKWVEEEELAQSLPGIVWKFDFGINSLNFSLTDELTFRSLSLAIETFTQNLYPKFKDKTFGVILFEGDADLTENFRWNEQLKEACKNESPRRFCLSALSEYLHQLSASFPDDIAVIAQFDATGINDPIESAHLFSKEIFPHIIPAVKGAQLPQFGLRWQTGKTLGGFIGRGPLVDVKISESKCGFVLPERVDSTLIQDTLQSLHKSYRLIDEAALAESWDELEEIIVIDELMTVLGKRKLKAFEAAGGKVSG